MRSFVLFTLTASFSLFIIGNLQAGGGGYRHSHHNTGYHSNGAFRFSGSPHVQNSNNKNCCTTSSRTRTVILSRKTRRQPYHDGRGRLYHNTETVVTYKKIYRDGSYKIYCKTYPGY